MNLETLNPEQREATTITEGPVLVIAGAGSGKTRVLTQRIAGLIEEKDVFPSTIMAITFTNKAAQEMRERIEALIGPVTAQMWVGTFHAICVRILRRNSDRIGYTSDFVIYDTTDQKALLKTCYKELGIDDKRTPLKTAQYKISSAKNDMMTPELYDKEFGGDYREKEFIKLYTRYQDKIKQNQAMDFDDLLLNTLYLFKQAPDVLEYYQNRFKYVHVDEYQDTNRAQYLFIKMISAKYLNLFVVGDADQSIYKWRGADIRNIREFEDDYQGAKIIKLEQNYRSSQNILNLANSVIKNNPKRRDKNLWTDRADGEKIGYYQAYDEKDEAHFIVNYLKKLNREENIPFGDAAILYRTNAQSRSFEDALVLDNIPYKVIGGLKFYERKEIKDVLAYMKLIVNPYDDVSFMRVVNEPKRAIGAKSLEKISGYALESGIGMLEACRHSVAVNELTAKARAGLKEFVGIIEDLNKAQETLFVSELFDELIARTKIIEIYEQEKNIEADGRIDNIYEFKAVIEEFEKRSESPNLRDFLAETSLRSDQDQIETDETGVLLMTLHASKGLEFPNVFLVGLEEDLFPSFRAKDDDEALEEERRLCYVGITRAQNRLVVSHANHRNQYGRYEARFPSCFIKEMDVNLFENLSDRTIEDVALPKREKSNSYFGITPPKKNKAYFKESVSSETISKSGTGEQKETSSQYKAGIKVKHKQFGEGLIIAVDEDGSLVTVAFNTSGIKKLHLDYAPLIIL